MTRGERGGLPYLPSLDGLRGIAVAAVLLFHADVAWLTGGHLGVSVFFTLSGFLITSLLLVERDGTGGIRLGSFWARRARRLVPALVLCFALIAAVVALSSEAPPDGLIGDAVASAGWFANWRFVFEGQTYADLFAAPSPFQHFWSLAVEEQFYVVFPLLVVGLLGLGRRPARRWLLAGVLGGLVVASTIQVARLHDPDVAIGRAYYGTDGRIAEILAGALLALALVGPSGLRRLGELPRWLIEAVGLAGAVGLGFAFATLGDHDVALYEGGFLAVAACSTAVIAAAVQPGSLIGWALANRPTVALGKVSYGAYLFHWPIFLLLTERSTGLDPARLFVVRVVLTLGLAAASYWFVESPIRYGRLPTSVGLVGWANGAALGLALIVLVSGQVVWPVDPPSPAEVAATAAAPGAPAPGSPVPGPAVGSVAAPGAAPPAPGAPAPGSAPAAAPTTAPPPADEARAAVPEPFLQDPEKAEIPPMPDTSGGKLRVAVVGDSLAWNLGRGLQIWAGEQHDVAVYNLAVGACPLSRGGTRRWANGDPLPVAEECGWWDASSNERRAAFEQFVPDVVVTEDGINEMLDRKLEDWDDYRGPEDARFDAWLRDEYQAAFSRWSAAGAAMVVVNTPCADWKRYEWFDMDDADVRVQALNVNVYGRLINTTVADLFSRICPAGQYQDEVEGYPYGRPDGFHFSDEAAAALARNWLGPMVRDAHARATPETPPTTLPVEPGTPDPDV